MSGLRKDQNVLFRVVSSICKERWEELLKYTIRKLNNNSIDIGIHKLIVKQQEPDSFHEFPSQVHKNIVRGGLPINFMVSILDSVSELDRR